MRTLLGCGLLLLLAACQARGESEQAGDEAGAQAAANNVIECALDGASEFTSVCSVEKADVEGTRVLIVLHPNGGFRRFDVLTDGRGLAATDGADKAKLTIEGQVLGVAVDNDRYRFPMTLKSDDPAK